MNKTQEDAYLYNQRRSDGFSSEESNEEVKAFRDSQREFKILKREHRKLKTVVRNLEEKNKDQLERIKDLVERIRNLKEYKTEKRGKAMLSEQIEKEEKEANPLYVKRIMKHLKKGVEYTQTEISNELMIKLPQLRPTLRMLVSIGMVIGEKRKDVVRYTLK